MKKPAFYSIFVFIFCTITLNGQVITIGDSGDYPNLEAAESNVTAGDTLLLQAQIFDDGTQFLSNLNGTASAPIVILAER